MKRSTQRALVVIPLAFLALVLSRAQQRASPKPERDGFVPSQGNVAIGQTTHGSGYGAVAYNEPTKIGYITVDMESQARADEEAIRLCNNRCLIVRRFENSCAALAIDNANGSTIWAVATSSDPNSAMQTAINACMADGGGQCYTPHWACDGVRYLQR